MGSNHYYSQQGGPVYTVIGSNGKERNTTVADARKLNLVPSYSTITNSLNKEGLNIWNLDQAMLAAIEWPYKEQPNHTKEERAESIADWKKEVKEIAGKLGGQGRDRGTMVHDALEGCYKGQGLALNLHQLIMPVLELVDDTFALSSADWEAEASFAHQGYGGKVDLHSKVGDGIVIDFKTKDVDDIKKMKPYPNDVMQHAAYRDGLGIPKANCYSLFVNVKVPGMLVLHEWKEEEVVRGREMFEYLKLFWYANNRMESK